MDWLVFEWRPIRVGGIVRCTFCFKRFRVMHCDGGNKSITAPVERLDVTRCFGRIAQRDSEFVHRPVQPSIEINEGMVRPKGVPQLIAGHNLTWVLEQEEKKVEWLVLKFDAEAVLAQFS